MSEDANGGAAPAAPAPGGAPAAPAQQGGGAPANPAGGQQPTNQNPASPAGGEFKVPDAYKDKAWAKNVKSNEDLWKQFDNTQQLIGKRAAPPDFEKATAEEIESYLASTRPSDKSAYKFEDGTPEEFKGAVGEIFLKNGISAYQGNKVIEAYNKLENQRLAEATSADGFKSVMTKSFGEKYEGDVREATAEMTKHLSKEDQALLNAMPNEYLGAMYRFTRAMQKAYGVKESGGAHTESQGGQPQGQDINARRSELRKQIRELDAKPHTQAQRQKLIDDLQATYKS